MKVKFGIFDLAGRDKVCASRLKNHYPYVFGSYENFKLRLRQTFEPPRAEFRARADLLDLKQGKRDLHSYGQHTRYLVSCIMCKPIDEQKQLNVFIKVLADGPIKTHLFRLELETFDEAISVTELEYFSLIQDHVHTDSYRPAR